MRLIVIRFVAGRSTQMYKRLLKVAVKATCVLKLMNCRFRARPNRVCTERIFAVFNGRPQLAVNSILVVYPLYRRRIQFATKIVGKSRSSKKKLKKPRQIRRQTYWISIICKKKKKNHRLFYARNEFNDLTSARTVRVIPYVFSTPFYSAIVCKLYVLYTQLKCLCL